MFWSTLAGVYWMITRSTPCTVVSFRESSSFNPPPESKSCAVAGWVFIRCTMMYDWVHKPLRYGHDEGHVGSGLPPALYGRHEITADLINYLQFHYNLPSLKARLTSFSTLACWRKEGTVSLLPRRKTWKPRSVLFSGVWHELKDGVCPPASCLRKKAKDDVCAPFLPLGNTTAPLLSMHE